MSPKYWVSSEDLSADSSLESQARSRELYGEQDGSQVAAEEEINLQNLHAETESMIAKEAVLPGHWQIHPQEDAHRVNGYISSAERSSPQHADAGIVARTRTGVVLPTLPSLQPHQHASLLYLSLIEGRCRTLAANTINAGRKAENKVTEDHSEVLALSHHLFADMQRELIKAGLIPEDFAAPGLQELRRYLTSFDTLVTNLATQRTFDFSGSADHQALPGFQSPSFNSNVALVAPRTSLFTHNRGHIARNYIMPREGVPQLQGQPSKLSLLLSGVQNTLNHSVSTTEYVRLATLGKGGYGEVYKARYRLDGAEYAIKKIVLKADYLTQLLKEGRLQKVFTEIKVLASLDHHHIVRYHHCWLETRHCGVSSSADGQDVSESRSKASSNSGLTSTNANDASLEAITAGVESIQFDIERELDKYVQRERRATITTEPTEEEFSRTGFVFEEDSKSAKLSSGHSKSQSKQPQVKEPKGMFRRPGEADSSDSDSSDEFEAPETAEEEIPRMQMTKATKAEAEINEDAVLFIKMTPYPLTLYDFMWPRQLNTEMESVIKHCFHQSAAIRLLLAILDGVEYLHRKGIFHRDLKPQNIFLSVLDPSEKPTQGYINISTCNNCRPDINKNYCFVCPRIGDFGLVHIKELGNNTPSDSNTRSPSFASSNAGTLLYTPPYNPKIPAIVCEKIDVFALGIIAFELVYKFETDAERRQVLSRLGLQGAFPPEFAGHKMREGIGHMVHKEREKRWGCAEVRNWLEALRAKSEMRTHHRRSLSSRST